MLLKLIQRFKEKNSQILLLFFILLFPLLAKSQQIIDGVNQLNNPVKLTEKQKQINKFIELHCLVDSLGQTKSSEPISSRELGYLSAPLNYYYQRGIDQKKRPVILLPCMNINMIQLPFLDTTAIEIEPIVK